MSLFDRWRRSKEQELDEARIEEPAREEPDAEVPLDSEGEQPPSSWTVYQREEPEDRPEAEDSALHEHESSTIDEEGNGEEEACEYGSGDVGEPPAGGYGYDEPSAFGPYASSDEHLWDHLARVDQLVRARTVRWQRAIADHKPEHLWGMIHVTDAEIRRYLKSEFVDPEALPPELVEELRPYWEAADRLETRIRVRIQQTPDWVDLRLRNLVESYDLTSAERDVLLVCLLPDLDGRYRRLFGYLQDDASRMRPSVELVLGILQRVGRELEIDRSILAPEGQLLAHHLLAVGPEIQGDEPLSVRGVRVDDRIVDYLLGGNTLDGRLDGIAAEDVTPVSWRDMIVDAEPPDPKKPSRLDSLKALADWWQQRKSAQEGGVIFMRGLYGSGRLDTTRAICTVTRTPLLVIAADEALRSPHGFALVVDLAYREAQLRQAAIHWLHCEQLLDAEGTLPLWNYLVAAAEQYAGLSVLASQAPWDPAGRFHTTDFLRQEFPVPLYPVRLRLWDRHLPSEEQLALEDQSRSRLVEGLANGFQLTEGQILDAIAAARHLATQRDPIDPRITSDDLYEGCRRQSGRRLISFARRVEPRPELTFDDLVLPSANTRQLQELRNRIHYRNEVLSGTGFEQRLSLGKGLIALFTGTSGTGKTMAAQLLASEQGVDLYKVDMSAVVSKYVGETEKNLSRVFAEAEDSNAIVFFDEADALFGKRGKVEEARDRWANLEVNYLLQRIEEYAGVVILATNLRQNIDEAFIRRIHVIVDFPFPDGLGRYRIWRGLFPPGVLPPPQSQLETLAERFSLAGGNIQNIVVDATFRARARRDYDQDGLIRVQLRDLVLATAREYQKLGRPLGMAEFGAEFYEWVEEDVLLAPAPAKEVRYRLWLQVLAAYPARPSDAELAQLAERFELREHQIRAVVEDAVQRAMTAQEVSQPTQVVVSQRDLVLAIARYFQAQGRELSAEIFGPQFFGWLESDGPEISITTKPANSLRFWRMMFADNTVRPPDEELLGLAERFPYGRAEVQEIVTRAAQLAYEEDSLYDHKIRVTLRHLVFAVADEHMKRGQPITRTEFGPTFYAWLEEWKAQQTMRVLHG